MASDDGRRRPAVVTASFKLSSARSRSAIASSAVIGRAMSCASDGFMAAPSAADASVDDEGGEVGVVAGFSVPIAHDAIQGAVKSPSASAATRAPVRDGFEGGRKEGKR